MCSRVLHAGSSVLAHAFPLLVALLSACASSPSAVEEALVFYPEPPDPPRVQFLRTISLGTDIEGGRSSLDELLFGEQKINKTVMAPYGVAMHDGVAYVCDVQQGVILTLDIRGKSFDFLRTQGRGNLRKPNNLCFAPDGRLYVADFGRQQVVVFDEDLTYAGEYGPYSESSRPVDVVYRDGRLYIADPADRCIRVVDAETRKQLLSFGAPPPEGAEVDPENPPVTLRAPTNIAFDGDGNLAVVDTIDCRVFVWSPEGEFLHYIGAAGDTVGSFARPKGIAVRDGLFFVVDAAFENVQILDPTGEPMMYFGGGGVGPGDLYLPTGIWIGTDGLEQFRDQLADGFRPEALIVVCSQFGPRKVNFYALGKSDDFDYSTPAPAPGAGGAGGEEPTTEPPASAP